ncbi:mucin-5AC isoform X2 [Bradysia coprophila]|uniref:mucin-5AC isoform X2 n=1 Tax=Bradysia coprophila TaxID=38358 RepID=UPI00187DD666|nr:mucin-5AC isoform X2 [Bradysia coprophila]
MWVPSGLPFMLGLFLYLSSGLEAQSRRPASRVFTTNIKSSSNSDFNCPEEFGYYPHPTDCSQYYVCVFGGALLESCTGGLMYSHELQTCDWPRNVGCELSDNIAPSAIDRQVTPRIPQIQTIQPQAHTSQPQKFRFSSPSAPSSSGQGIPARVHAIPPPPQLKVAPNPVITSRGQPKFEEEKDLAELYAEAHETLPPVEEEESDRQQRVYRGQPSTVTQVQRDRDGLLHQPSVNAISTHGKIGSFAFGSQIGQHSDRKKAHADRIKRDIETETYTNETLAIQTSSPSTSDEYKRSPRQLRPPPIARSPWQFGNNDQYNNDKQFQPRLTVNQNYNPFLTVPQSTNSSPYFKPREQSNAKPEYNPYANSYSKANNAGGEQAKTSQFHSNPSYRYVDQDNFYANNFKASTKDPLYPDTQNTPIYSNNAKPKFKPAHDDRLPDNFSFFHFGNDNRDEREHRKIISPQEFVNKLPNVAILPNATPKNQFISFSTVGGFYNNQPTTQSPIDDYKEFSKFRQSNANGKLSFSTPRPNVYHSSPAPVYESTDDYYDYGKGSYVGSFYSTTPPPHQQYSTPPRIFYQPVTTTQRSNFYNKAITKHQELPTTYSPQYEYPTTQKPQHRQHSNIQTTTPRVAPDITSHTYYPVNVAFQQIDTKEHHKSPAIFNYHVVKDEITKPTQKTQRFFVTKKSTAESTTTSPPPTTQKHSTIKLGDDFTGPLVGLDFDFDKFVAGIRETHLSQLDAKIANHYKDKALNTTPKKTYVDVSRATTTARSIPDSSTWKPVETTTVTFGSRVERTTWKPTTKLNKLLETGGLVNKSTPKPFFKYTALSNDFRYQTSTAPTTAKTQSTTLDSDEYYYEDDEEDEEEAIEKEKEQLDVLKQKPTPTPSVRPSTRSPKGYESFINSIPKKPTTKLQLVNNETSDDDDDEYYYDDDEDDDAIHSPPAIKSQFVPLSETMAPRPPTTPSYRNSSYHTHFPFLQHTTPSPDNVFNRNQQTATIPAFITFPKDIFQDIKPLNNIQRYLNHSTLRPYTKRTRLGSTSAPEFTTEFLFTTTTTTLPPTTTTTRTSTTTRKIYTIRPNRGQPRWKLQKSIDGTKNNKNLLEYDDKVGNRVEQSTQSPTVYIQQPSSRPIPQNNNRNYYNTTNSNAGYSNPSQFDSYYSVYDEDVELYRDIDYGQQYTTVTQKPIQSTYRPSTVSTQSPPRETYVKQEPVYEQRPVSSYNPDYDEALIAQLEGDSTYDHPPRNQLRGNEINSISDNQFAVTSTRSPNVGYSSTTYTPTKQIYTTLSTTASPQITSTRSTLLDDDNNTTSETIILKLSTRAGIPAALVPSNPNNIPSNSPLTQSNRNNQPSEINVQVLPNHPFPDSTKTKNPTRLIRTNDNVDARILTLSSGYQARSRSADSVASTTTLSPKPSDIESQRQKILNFVVSDAQPQSFQPRPSTTSTTTTTTTTSTTFRPPQYSEQLGEELDSQNAFVNRPSSIKSYPTTTTNAPNALISGIHLPANRLPKTENIKLVLTSGLRDVSNEEIKQPEVEQGSVEIVPLYIRESNGKPLVDATVEPTTYAPAKPFRSIKRPTVFSDAIAEIDSQDGEESMTNIQQRPYEQNLESAEFVPTPASPTKLVSKFSYKYLDDRNYRNKPSINEPAPYFTSRSNNFKEVLNKTYETSTTSKLFVSPYTSLRSILQDESVKSTSLRPVIRPSPINNKNHTLASSSPPPLRSYYSITGTPRSISTSSTTNRFIKSTTEPTTTTSTDSTTTTTKSTIPTTTTAALSDQWISLSSTEIDRYVKSPKKLIQHSNRNQYQSFSTTENSVENDEPTTYSPNQPEHAYRRKVIRTRPYVSSTPPPVQYDEDDNDEVLDVIRDAQFSKLLESVLDTSSKPKKYETRRVSNQVVPVTTTTTEQYPENVFDSTTRLIEITDRPHQYFSHYRHLSTERTVGSAISSTQRYVNKTTPKLSDEQLRERFRATVEMPEFNIPTESERKLYKHTAAEDDSSNESDLTTTLTNTITEVTTQSTSTTTKTAKPSRTTTTTEELPVPSTSTTPKSSSTTNSINTIPPRASRVNAAIKTTIAAASLPRRATKAPVTLNCTENSPNAKCNEIPSRTNSNTRNRGTSHFSTASGDDRPATVAVNRGTHPPRSRPTLKPSGTIVSKAQEFVDIYRNPPSRPEPLYPQPTPDKTAARCRKDVCLLPDCSCGGKEIPGNIPPKQTPQIVLITFDDAVNDLNKDYYEEIFERGRKNPNGCPITATFYVSHEWTDYGQVQSLYANGHEMASHTVSHSFGEQFSQKKWTREVAGQREILAAYGGVKLNDVRGMRAPFLSVGGNKMFKMLYDSNFTYDSSMPVYENRPPSWPYTLDYKIFHDCMIPPCPTKSYPGVWQVPMVMWQDLNGGRCSMGDACANPPESDGVMKMLMKNFDRHYSTNRAPFGLFYHAAWFTQPHHKEGFIKFLDTINAMNDVWIVTNWQALQWVRDPTPIERINQFQPFQCDYSDRPKRCNNPKVCNLWHKSGVRYMRTCQPCPEIYPWTGKTGIRSSRVDNDVDE